jgi:hypothetical protein
LKSRACCLLVLLLIATATTVHARTWKDKSGKFSIVATLVSVKDGIVTLKKVDGKEVSLAVEKLSDADRAYLEKEVAKAPADAPAEVPKEDLPEVKGDEKYEVVVKWARTETEPIAISKLPDVLFRTRDGQPIKQVFYAFEMDIKDGNTNKIVTERESADKAIKLDKSEGVIPMSTGPVIPPSAAMDLVLRTARGLTGSGELRVGFFSDSKGKKQISDWLAIPVDLSK